MMLFTFSIRVYLGGRAGRRIEVLLGNPPTKPHPIIPTLIILYLIDNLQLKVESLESMES